MAEKKNDNQQKIALIAHLYYLEESKIIIERCKQYTEYFDFYFTLPDFGSDEIKTELNLHLAEYELFELNNEGADILPFFNVILKKKINHNYKCVLKMHTKKFVNISNKINFNLGKKWFLYSLNTLLPKNTQDFLFLKNNFCDKSFYTGPSNLLLNIEKDKFTFFKVIEKKMNIINPITSNLKFFAGSMFYISTNYLKFIENIDINDKKFIYDANIHDNKVTHYFERYFGCQPTINHDVYQITTNTKKIVIFKTDVNNKNINNKINLDVIDKFIIT